MTKLTFDLRLAMSYASFSCDSVGSLGSMASKNGLHARRYGKIGIVLICLSRLIAIAKNKIVTITLRQRVDEQILHL